MIDSRLRAYEGFVATGNAYPEVREFSEHMDLRARVAQAIERAAAGLSGSERATSIPQKCWRMNSGDFGPQNLLFTDYGDLTAVDFESGGWDDPARLVMGFLAHATAEDLSVNAADSFLAAYAGVRDLSAVDVSHFERTGRLLDIEWVAVYASAVVPEVIAAKEFADPAFDRQAYLEGAIARLRRRLERVSDAGIYRFPGG